MGKLIRMDRTGHTTLAEWTADDDAALARAMAMFTADTSVARAGASLPEARALS